ncbi:hypothetical protein QR676_00045 [Vibrio sp. TMPB1044]|uniref:hypothetical protein n=1 Tax=Vibrio sp. TMPB1044 TaxID=3051822 RepID=UPI00255B9D3C|nr:hypothetical protein [Vibrio sp. TMPB1044]MDL5025608.1 hypothetical protein [Vibrio sp. TMPB1044]MDN5205736.1 hypothetical protein [Vibrio sp. TMPB1044]
MKGSTVFLVTSVLLLVGGCGGGGEDSSTSASNDSFSSNGIYFNSTDFAVLLVDSSRSENNLIVGDFGSDSVYFTDSATTTKNQMKTVGVTYADEVDFLKDSSQEITADFNDTSVELKATFNGRNLAYSMNKVSDSLPLPEIVGTHTDTDGTTWEIFADGSFIVNGICTVTGNLVRKGAYFNVEKASATSCALTQMNGAYSGVLLTVQHQGIDYLAGLLGSETALLWGSAPKS